MFGRQREQAVALGWDAELWDNELDESAEAAKGEL